MDDTRPAQGRPDYLQAYHVLQKKHLVLLQPCQESGLDSVPWREPDLDGPDRPYEEEVLIMAIEERNGDIFVDDVKVFKPFCRYLGGSLGEETKAEELQKQRFTFKPITQQTLQKHMPHINTGGQYRDKIVEWIQEAESLRRITCVAESKDKYCFLSIENDLWPEISQTMSENIKRKCEVIEYDLYW